MSLPFPLRLAVALRDLFPAFVLAKPWVPPSFPASPGEIWWGVIPAFLSGGATLIPVALPRKEKKTSMTAAQAKRFVEKMTAGGW